MSAKLVPLRRVSGDTAQMSDEALLAACGTGDGAALGALFDRFNEVVYRFAGRLARTDELARDDLVQATFLEIRRTAGTFRGTSAVRTWILGVASNVARHTLRSERRLRSRQAKYVAHMTSVPMGIDEQVEQRKLLARVEEVLAELPHDQRIAFILCDIERLPVAEVAQGLAIPEGTLSRRLHTARKSMRDAIVRTER